MATKKKARKPVNAKEKEIEKQVETLEKNIQEIEEIEEREEFNKNVEKKKEEIKEDLKNQLMSQSKYGKQFDDMIEDYLYLVGLKEILQRDIAKNGLRYKTTGGNGFTSYKPNESCERLLKTNAQMLKILQDLDLKAPEEAGEGDDLL